LPQGNIPGLDLFLRSYPRMSVAPIRDDSMVLSGIFNLKASSAGKPHITDSYELEIQIPSFFPKEPPSVIETAMKIPRDDKHHVNPDNTLCLGSPLRLRWKLSQYPSLVGFTDECLVPYLYGVSHKIKYGVFPFGELDHGEPGVIDDYLDLFKLGTKEQVRQAILLLGMKRRRANKQTCPCGCGARLGTCVFHHKINEFRRLADRPWFRRHLNRMGNDK